MCGVAGALQQPDGKMLVTAMVDCLAHRGPDAGGVVEVVEPDSAVVLGHRRLSIIDLSSAADQPLSKDGLTLTFNGEIYNFREIRRELEGQGAKFVTRSDTEVVLEAWRAWGSACLRRLRGMFAFALYDRRTGTLVLARDPLGIKPLFFMPRGDGVIFASELKAIIEVVGPELKVNPAGMVASALYYWLPEQTDAVEGVHKLPAGAWSEHHRDGSVEVQQYWRAAEEATMASAGPPRDLGDVIEESVKAHLVSDVPVASFLSGGLDSSIVTALAHRESPSIEAYTIAFRAQDQKLEAMPDDAHFARVLADRLQVKLHEIELRPDVVDSLPRMVEALDEPIGDPAAINTYLMCREARRDGHKVVLSGMGADELFGGYRKHLANTFAGHYQRIPKVLRRGVIAPLASRLPVAVAGHGLRAVRWGQRFLSFAELDEEEAFRRSYTMYDVGDLQDLLDPDLRPQVIDIADAHRSLYWDNVLSDHVNRMCLADARLFMSGLNLSYTDRASMAASVEVRVPFVDPVVFRSAFALSGADKIRGRVQKAALKEVARRWLPDEIVDRPKASFGAPLRAWVTHDLSEMIDTLLVPGDLVSSGFLQEAQVLKMIAEQRGGRHDWSKQIWQLLSMELWYRHVRSKGVGAA